MSFEEFEKNKIRLNQLNNMWFKAIDVNPPPRAEIKKLESQINTLKADLEANIDLALSFQPARGFARLAFSSHKKR